MWHSILEFFGIVGESGKGYAFWSGLGSDLGELGILAGLVTLVRQKNCHVHHCWRLGRHQVAGTPYTVCRRHHPDDHLTHADVLEAHATWRGP